MQDTSKRPSRRAFLQKGASASVLFSLFSCSTTARHSPVGPRRVLHEPGPMLPPVPAVLLTVRGAPGDPDEISVVWTFVLNGTPPQVGISVGNQHVARDLVSRHGQFVLNVPSADLVEPFDLVDMSSTRVEDKFALSGLTRGSAVNLDAPTVQEAPIQVECRVFQELELPPSRRVFFADVVATTVREGVCDEAGRLDVGAADVFGMTAGSGEFYTMGKNLGHIGQSVGRTDIKY